MLPNEQAENKMGTAPVPGLVIKMALPVIISMLTQALYNIVDSIFVARINENALTAVSMCFPMQIVITALATGTATGVNALVSRNLGEKDFAGANRTAAHGIFLATVTYIVFALVILAVAGPFVSIQLAADSDPEIYEFALTYLNIISLVSFGIFYCIMFERLLNSTGKTHLTMISQVSGVIFNIIFDPILIFGYFGFPKMGVAGAAVATVAGQILGAVIALCFNLIKNKEISLSLKGFRPSLHLIGSIYRIAIPTIVLQCIGTVMTILINRLLIVYSSTAVAVFGIYFKLTSFTFFPIFGLTNALVPVIAYNYGSKHKKRMNAATKTGIIFATAVMLIGTFIFYLIPDKLLWMFDASDDMLKIGIPALRAAALQFPFAGFSMILGTAMQAVGEAIYGTINSFMRQIVVLTPVAYLLSWLGGLDMIWWSFVISEAFSAVTITIFYIHVYKKKFAPLPD